MSSEKKETYIVRCSECGSVTEVRSTSEKTFTCSVCGGTHEIDNIVTIPTEKASSTMVLEEVSTKYKFLITKEGVFGRHGDFETEILKNISNSDTISGKHLKITYDADTDDWFIEMIGETNPTVIDRIEELKKGEKRQIMKEKTTRISMGAVTFRARIE